MQLTEQRHGTAIVVQISGRLDSNTAGALEARTQHHLAQAQGDLVLDFTMLDYIASAGLRVILRTAKGLASSPHRLFICGMQEHVREVFRISGFDTLIPIRGSLEECLQA